MILCTHKTHICLGKLTIIGSDNSLSPGWRQVIFWTNTGILLTGPKGANFSEILIEIYIFSSKKMHLKTSAAKCRLIFPDLNMLNVYIRWCVLLWLVQVDVSLTHLGRDKMAAVSQTTLSNAFSWMNMLEFRLRFQWSLFLRVQLTIFQHWFR